jgi:hypothetical protein
MWHVWGGIRDFYGETQRNETSVEDLGMYGGIKCCKKIGWKGEN